MFLIGATVAGHSNSLAAGSVLGDKVADDLLRVALGIEVRSIDKVAAALQKSANNL